MLTEQQKDVIRQNVRDGIAPLAEKMAHLYLGRSCPLLSGEECRGPFCQFFMPMGDETGKITRGACAIALATSTLPQVVDQLGSVAAAAIQANGVRVLKAP